MDWHHITPIDDLIDHDTSGHHCICGPAIDIENKTIIHSSLDRRECFEDDSAEREDI
jgi:hypothetical protein